MTDDVAEEWASHRKNRLLASLFAGLAATFLARGMGVEWWTDWTPGDAADIGLCAALGVNFALRTIHHQ